MSPFRDLLAAGDTTGYGSDWDNVAEPDPWFALEVMVTRRNPDEPQMGQLGALQAIDLPTAIEVMTYNGAYNLQREDDLGSIEVGKTADFIVLSQNILEVPTTKVHETKVLQTVLGGKTVHTR
jgi:predicted amidohydrolase YtcJ